MIEDEDERWGNPYFTINVKNHEKQSRSNRLKQGRVREEELRVGQALSEIVNTEKTILT